LIWSPPEVTSTVVDCAATLSETVSRRFLTSFDRDPGERRIRESIMVPREGCTYPAFTFSKMKVPRRIGSHCALGVLVHTMQHDLGVGG